MPKAPNKINIICKMGAAFLYILVCTLLYQQKLVIARPVCAARTRNVHTVITGVALPNMMNSLKLNASSTKNSVSSPRLMAPVTAE